ncbi:DUF3592 domain-containing protein [Halomonas dongshanensis]|uniref:DUF3592 domain-containing protein n=1 Tax=Halomonas dongshanensis TaxID=2890835 RepID=A0ABT2EEY9_9GAMM|nr:DUF3592 domain-containing protein [Halomonas dongshanensis]MCS2610146.1 DUF3592 domain-containing protein [Halomonas dongshanensis]
MRAIALIKYIALVVGIALLAGSLYFYFQTNAFLESAERTQGTVVRLAESRSEDSTTYRPVISFAAPNGDAIEFISSTGSNPPSYSPGEPVSVLFDTDNPYSARLESFFSLWGGAFILGGLGAVFTLFGVAAFFIPVLSGGLSKRNKAALKRSGLRLETELQGVERNTGFSVNGRYPFRIVSQWHDTTSGQVYVFYSENIWFDPSAYLEGDSVIVFVEPGNPKRYYVDTEFLPKLAS